MPYDNDKYACLDPGSIWGELFEGAFKDSLEHGYLPPGSLWMHKRSGKLFMIIGEGAPKTSSFKDKFPQRLRRINGSTR